MHKQLAILRKCEREAGATGRHFLRRFPASNEQEGRAGRQRPGVRVEDPCGRAQSPRTVTTVRSSGIVFSRSLCASLVFHVLALLVYVCLPKPPQALLLNTPIVVCFTAVPEQEPTPVPIPQPTPAPAAPIDRSPRPSPVADTQPHAQPIARLTEPAPAPASTSKDESRPPDKVASIATRETIPASPLPTNQETPNTSTRRSGIAVAPEIHPTPNADGPRAAGAESPDALAHPLYKKNPEPGYPLSARRRRQEGVVLLKVQVSEAGKATQVELQHSSGYASLDDTALQAVKKWEFEPARSGARHVPCTIEVPVRFVLKP